MDDRQFDTFVKSLARARNRRSVLAGLLGLGSAALTGALRQSSVEAARRPKPTPRPVSCPGEQHWNGSACVCPDPLSECGPACCNDSVPTGTQDHSECCDHACCAGRCYGEELCCPWPREFCEITSECCADDSLCCADSGCCDPSAGRCCDVLGATICRTLDLCCDDSECTDSANSRCDLATGACVCVPSTCGSGQLGDICGDNIDDGCGGTIASCECGEAYLTCDDMAGSCQWDCTYWNFLTHSPAGSVLEVVLNFLCEAANLCDANEATAIFDEWRIACSTA